MKKYLIALTGAAVILGACGNNSGSEEKQEKTEKVTTEAVTTENPTTEAPTTEKPDTVDTSSLKDAAGRSYEIPKKIKEIAGTYSGVLGEEGYAAKDEFTVKINEDGTYTMFDVEKTDLSDGATMSNEKNKYINKDNQLMETNSDVSVKRVESGVVVEKYGTNVLVPMYSATNGRFIDQNGQIDIARSIGNPYEEAFTLSSVPTRNKVEKGAISMGTLGAINKVKSTPYDKEISQTIPELYNSVPHKDREGNMEYRNVNDLYQLEVGPSYHDVTVLSKEGLNEVYTVDNKKIKAKFGIITKDGMSKVLYVADDKKFYKVDDAEKAPYVVRGEGN